jgi:CheY-like chemotaxis protein
MTPSPIRVLLVDDEEDFVEMLSLRLEASGYEVECAASGPEGLEKLESFSPQVIILDVKMPGMDGYEVLDEVQRKTPGLPVVLMTGHGDAARGEAHGAFATMIKPADYQELTEIINKAASG